MNAKLSNGKDTKAVAQDRQRDDRHREHRPLPTCAEEETTCEQAGNKEHQTGANAAALLGNHEPHFWKLELHAAAENRRAGAAEHRISSVGRGVLKEYFDPMFEDMRKRHHEHEKCERETDRAQ